MILLHNCFISGRGVTANMPVLGTGDSGFESRRPDKVISVSRFQKIIWDNYEKSGRSMPWRGERDPYKVLVSEVMLQQTQVSRVIPKYIEFVKRFSTIKILANASLGDVLKMWSGLGYNRRARFLHQLAKKVEREYKWKIPCEARILETLPGLGKATAGSVSTFAYNIPNIFIETNIRRVFIHFYFPNSEKVSDKDILPFISKTLDREHPREWYYALMDYGAQLKTQENPNRRSKHYARQSVFKGSNREVRGAILKNMSTKKITVFSLRKRVGFDEMRFAHALQSLIDEGFITKVGNTVQYSQ